MSGRQLRDDGWDDSHYGRGAAPGSEAYPAPAVPSFQPATGGGNESPSAGGYGSTGSYDPTSSYGSTAAYDSASAYGPTGANGSSGYGSAGYGDDRYGAGTGQDDRYGDSGQRGAPIGYAGGGRSEDGSRAAGGNGYQGGYARNGSAGNAGYAGLGYAPEFSPFDNNDADDDASPGTPRPYGRLSIFTLHEERAQEFDRLAERAAEGVRESEPDTLVYVIHVVPKAPMQRIIYEIYRDRAAFTNHERQPHIRQFAADRVACVIATNIIDLRLKYAKVAALGPVSSDAPAPYAGFAQQAAPTPSAAATAQVNDRQAASTQHSPIQYSPSTYSPAQYQAAPAQGQGAGAAASFTPAGNQAGADNGQYPTAGREAYSPAAQYANPGNGAYGASDAQYGTANGNGYSGAAGYANGGSYSGSNHASANGYQGSNGYSGGNGYSGANGYQGNNGYPSANGYSNGAGYSDPNSYANGDGYSGATGQAGGGGYAPAGGYEENGPASYAAPAGTQQAPRFRELTSGPQADPAVAYPGGDVSWYADDARSAEQQ